MKKLYLTFVVILAITQFSYAQWTMTSPYIFSANGHNVGIGTTAAQSKLHIAGAFNNLGTGIQDIYDRPGLAITGKYPQMVLMAGGDANVNHGSTISLGAFDSGTSGAFKSWTIGTPGINATFMDIGWGTNPNPHGNGIAGIGTTVLRLTNTGRVGINTLSPDGKLTIATPLDGSVAALAIGDGSPGNTNVPVGTSTGGYNIDFHTWRDIIPNQIGARIRAERINSFSPGSALIQSMDLSFSTSAGVDQSYLTEKMRIRSDGNIGIGTQSPDEKLTVNGKIHAKEIRIDTSIPTPDYVFNKGYPLMSLTEVKNYIDKHHHLPEVPSAAEVEENGLKLAEMNLILLKKVEELTLHLIKKDKQVTDQQRELSEIKQELQMLKKSVSRK